MKSYFILASILVTIHCFSQEAIVKIQGKITQTHVEIRGKVLDRMSMEALPYANISITNSSLGTISNEAGEFEFFVPIDLIHDTLLISYIGYKTFKERITGVSEVKNIYLEESPIVLSEIIVTSEDAKKIVEEALKAIPFAFPTTPYLMEAFHRSWEHVDYTDSINYPGTLIEVAITIYDGGYGQKNARNRAKEEIYINEIRRSAMMEGWNYDLNFLRDLLDKNLIKYNRGPAWIFIKSFLVFPNDLVYEWEGTTRIDDEDLSIIRISVPNTRKFPAFYKVYISEKDHAILRFDLYGEKKEIDYAIGPWHTASFYETYMFKRYQQKPYLSYVKKQYTVKNLDQIKKKVLRTENYYRELLINNVITTDVEAKRRSLSQVKAKDVSLALQTREYNETFWKSYNVILENPLDKEIIQYFEQHGKLEKPIKSKKKGN